MSCCELGQSKKVSYLRVEGDQLLALKVTETGMKVLRELLDKLASTDALIKST